MEAGVIIEGCVTDVMKGCKYNPAIILQSLFVRC